jgi:hypothetical protein
MKKIDGMKFNFYGTQKIAITFLYLKSKHIPYYQSFPRGGAGGYSPLGNRKTEPPTIF